MDSAEGLRGAAAPSLSSTRLRPSLVLLSSMGARAGNSFPMPPLPFARGRKGKGRAIYVLRHAVITGHLFPSYHPRSSRIRSAWLEGRTGQGIGSRIMLFALCHILVEIWSSYQRKSAGGGKNTRSSGRVVFFFFNCPLKLNAWKSPSFLRVLPMRWDQL